MEEVLSMMKVEDAPKGDQPPDDSIKQTHRTSLWKTLTATGPTTPQAPKQNRGPQESGRGPPTERGFKNWLVERRECAAKGIARGFAPRQGFGYHCDRATRGWRVFVSAAGHLGLTAAGTEVGDAVCVFSGFRTPFAIRKTGKRDPEEGEYVLVGELYHYGVVSGALGPYLLSIPIRLC